MARTDRTGWTLEKRLAGAFATLIALTIVLGVTAVGSSFILRHGAAEMYTREMPALDALVEADRDLQQLLVAERTLLIAQPGSPLFDTLIAASTPRTSRQSDGALAAVSRAWPARPKELALVAGVRGGARRRGMTSTARILEARRSKSRSGSPGRCSSSPSATPRGSSTRCARCSTRRRSSTSRSAAANHARANQTFRYASMAVIALCPARHAERRRPLVADRPSAPRGRSAQMASNLRAGADQVVLTADSVVGLGQRAGAGRVPSRRRRLEETSASIEEIGSMAKSTADHADKRGRADGSRLRARHRRQSRRSARWSRRWPAFASRASASRRSSRRSTRSPSRPTSSPSTPPSRRPAPAPPAWASPSSPTKSATSPNASAQAARDTTSLIEESMRAVDRRRRIGAARELVDRRDHRARPSS